MLNKSKLFKEKETRAKAEAEKRHGKGTPRARDFMIGWYNHYKTDRNKVVKACFGEGRRCYTGKWDKIRGVKFKRQQNASRGKFAYARNWDGAPLRNGIK